MKKIGEILTAEQIADLASIMPNAGNAILEMTENQLDFLKGYIKSCKILNQSSRAEIILAKAKSDAERIEVNGINLIDREAAADILEAKSQMSIGTDAQIVFAAAARMIRLLPAVGEKPVRRGKWIMIGADKRGRGGVFECTACGGIYTNKCKFCPNCGAKMDLEAFQCMTF